MGIYLDNAATSYPKPKRVLDEVYDFMNDIGASSGRGAYRRALKADRMMYETRKSICKLFKFKKTSNVIFTLNITEAINLLLNGILKEGDHVITSSLEHNSVWRTLKHLEIDRGIEISTVECDKYGVTDPNNINKLIKKNTKLIVFNHASNVIGTIQPIKKIGKIAKDNNIPFIVDTAQTAGAIDIDINRDNIDILTFTGHKSLLGPMGTGGLLINSDIDISPLKFGGTGGDSKLEYQPESIPSKYEAGTPNVAGIAGLKKGIDFLLDEGIINIRKKEKNLVDYTIKKLNEVDKVTIYGPKNSDLITNVISFNVENFRPDELVYKLDSKYNIMLRSGLHCAPSIHRVMGTINTGAVRIGLGYFNSREDINTLIKALKSLIKNG
ncbi:MAG: aminotransferase class V-fold PLP-dependent enzyme [Firmicutes bacterium]|nr:aminotransferase class V-fold PLP-dependent enzyme [Bacillota bacterium]